MVSYRKEYTVTPDGVCLNPCCSGQWSRTYLYTLCNRIYMVVLILIVVEDDLVPRVIHRVQTTISLVLILIVVEDGLVQQLLLRMLFATLS